MVNFTSPGACKSCFRVMQSLVGTHNICITDLQQAKHQGLAENIAAFCSRSVPFACQPTPLVFVEGEEIPWTRACEMFLTPRLRHNTERAEAGLAEAGSWLQGSSDAAQGWPQPAVLDQTHSDLLQTMSGDLLTCTRVEDGMVIFRL